MIMTTMHDAYVVNYNDPPDPLFLEPDDFFFFLTAVPAISLLTMVSRLGSTSRHTLMGTWVGEHYQHCGKFRYGGRLRRWRSNQLEKLEAARTAYLWLHLVTYPYHCTIGHDVQRAISGQKLS